MPSEDLVLAVLPAEEDDVVTNLTGEIDESQINILEETAELFDFAYDFRHLRRCALELGMQFDDFLKAHRIDFIVSLSEFGNTAAEAASVGLKLAD